ncbi:restriction endonuclease subunit S [Chryseobacterium sp. PTM-20240506]|uniref:restriction endonuclease subunit S n=1 Tax=Chryseobacterium sp. PTM-20240506 TaxID=3400631 RepID=UPI003AAB2F66
MNKTENKLVPELRFPEFKNNGEWEQKKLGEIGKFIGGGTPDTTIEDYWDGEILWYTPTEVKNRNLVDSKRKITLKGLQNSSAKLLPIGALLITTRATIGDVGISISPCTTNQGFQSLVVNKDQINVFWYYWLKFNKKELIKRSSGSTFPEIGKNEITKIIASAPQKSEQQKIADCLSSLDELITSHNDKLEALKNHKKGLLQNLFPQEGETVPKFRFPEFVNDGDWKLITLGKLAENLDSKRIPITSNQREKGSIPYYGASGIIDYVKDHIFNETLLCISEDGANLIDRNYPIAFTIKDKTWVNNHAHVLKFQNYNTHVLVEKYINSINIQDFLTGAAQPKLNRGKLDIIPIPLPQNQKEQQKIAECLSSIDDLISSQTDKIEQLKDHKKGLMQRLFPKVKN